MYTNGPKTVKKSMGQQYTGVDPAHFLQTLQLLHQAERMLNMLVSFVIRMVDSEMIARANICRTQQCRMAVELYPGNCLTDSHA